MLTIEKVSKILCRILEVEEIKLEHPADERMGDFSTNIAMVLAKVRGKNPRELAAEMAERLKLDKELAEIVVTEKIEVAGPGFINLWLKNEVLVEMLSGDLKGRNDGMNGKRVLIDFSAPNIAKRFSVGHLRSTIIGQALENLYQASGARVISDNHLGDWGTQFGMIIAGVEEEKLKVSEMSVSELEELYVRFNKRVAEKPELKEMAREAFARLEKGEPEARAIWQQAVEVSMREFEKIYQKLGVTFDYQYGESAYEEIMPGVIQQAVETGVGVAGEGGAIIVKFEKDGVEFMSPAMLQKSNGTTTYLTRDLATIKKRLMDPELKSDLIIYEVGAEQTLHFRQLFEIAKRMWPETQKISFKHVAHGLMTLPEGKMSTRKGNTIKLEDLMNRAEDEAKAMVKSEGIDFERMGLNAIKYNELKRSPESNYVFRWEEALSMEGNSAPYINYAYVRASKVVKAAQVENGEMSFAGEEIDLARLLCKFADGEVVMESARSYAPQLLAGYLFEVAKKFNAFYDHNRVLGDEQEKPRLKLCAAVMSTLREGMSLLGVELVDKM